MDHLDKQIQDFWENRTTPEQRREILRQLEGSGMEWKDFLQQYYHKVLAGEEPGHLRDDQKNKIWQRLQEQHFTNETAAAPIVPLPGRVANLPQIAATGLPWLAAASVLFIIALFIYPKHQPPTATATATATTKPQQQAPTTIATTIVSTNATTGEQSLTLPDNSTVLLSPGTTIRYEPNFEAAARNIRLEGRALFDVAKDSARPFTVTARGYATTALATRLLIDATKLVVSIKLLTGKIVINSMADISLQKVYLTPGQELRINTTTKHQILNTTPPNPENNPSLSFERISLATVFQRLSAYYKTPIRYYKADLQGLSFTGEIKPADDLDLALKVICHMNQLSFTKEKGSIIIQKQQ